MFLISFWIKPEYFVEHGTLFSNPATGSQSPADVTGEPTIDMCCCEICLLLIAQKQGLKLRYDQGDANLSTARLLRLSSTLALV